MSCGETREKLPLYVGGDLDSEVLEAVRAHLEVCGACAPIAAEALRARRELVSAFRQPEALARAPGLWPGIRATLRSEGLIHEAASPAVRPLAAPARTRLHWGWALVPVAAAAALLLALQLGGGVENAPRAMPLVDVPPQSQIELVSEPAPTGGLQRLAPDQVQPLRAYQPPRGSQVPGGDASLAGFRNAK